MYICFILHCCFFAKVMSPVLCSTFCFEWCFILFIYFCFILSSCIKWQQLSLLNIDANVLNYIQYKYVRTVENMISCYCTNIICNKKISIYCTQISCHFAFYDHILQIFLVNVIFFTFYHSNDGSVGIPIPENIVTEIDTSFIFLYQLLMKIKPFLNFHTSIGGQLGFGHFMDTRGKIELGTISNIV